VCRLDRTNGSTCELAAHGVPETVQHDDLHTANVDAKGGRLRLLDWGDASVSHPFASLLVTFRFLEERNRLPPDDPWFTRLGIFAHAFARSRQRDYLPRAAPPRFDQEFRVILLRALARTVE
jgi:aminoglycoside phosphotransferase (APT) family kinase protein